MSALSNEEFAELEARGVSRSEIEAQLELFRNPPGFLTLDRASLVGDGISRFDDTAQSHCLQAFEAARATNRCMKFVPASGAASRMFKDLLALWKQSLPLNRSNLHEQAAQGRSEALAGKRFFENLRSFAFFEALRQQLRSHSQNVDDLLNRGEYADILEALLAADALDYAAKPKGLLPFHKTGDRAVTAFEEQLLEATNYARGRDDVCRVHCTVSPQHRRAFVETLAQVRSNLEQEHNVRFEVDFSEQKPSTDTIAVELDNTPFRDDQGHVLFRPGGHGALIDNLNDLDTDIVFIKNIDNVILSHLSADTTHWKRVLAGHLVRLQQQASEALRQLEHGSSNAVELARQFILEHVGTAAAGRDLDAESMRRFLHRPIRVCGMVPNTGEPGGGPFWVRSSTTGEVSLQIVEKAQIDLQDEEQRHILESSTHFNPVDLVCGIRDYRGHKFDLKSFVDERAVFIAEKSSHGRPLKALERPGLWNGAMADWMTFFVEVPISTFNPVKTVLDLLRPQHQG